MVLTLWIGCLLVQTSLVMILRLGSRLHPGPLIDLLKIKILEDPGVDQDPDPGVDPDPDPGVDPDPDPGIDPDPDPGVDQDPDPGVDQDPDRHPDDELVSDQPA